MEHKWKMGSIILITVMSFVLPIYTKASGGEEAEKVLFENFNTMDYVLFLETDVGYGLSLDYYRYGIFGDMTKSIRDGEALYFKLNESLTGNQFMLTEHMEWAENAVNEHIVWVSPDLEWMVTRQCRERTDPSGMEKVYKDKAFAEDGWFEWGECLWGYSIRRLPESGEYAVIENRKMKEAKNIMEDFWKHPVNAKSNFYVCFDENAALFAVPGEMGNHTIHIYGTSDWTLLHSLEVKDASTDCPIEVSQISGSEETGWLVFSCGDTTYRMTYPDGKTEKIGEFMYGTTYSPDGKYRAYCTGNFALYDMWEYLDNDSKEMDAYFELRSRWDAIPPGWYVEELETGNITYIPVEIWTYDVDGSLYGGRCVWLEKGRLQEVLAPQINEYEQVFDGIELGDGLLERGSYELAEERYMEAKRRAASIYFDDGKKQALDALERLYEEWGAAKEEQEEQDRKKAADETAAAELVRQGDSACTEGDYDGAMVFYLIALEKYTGMENAAQIAALNRKIVALNEKQEEVEARMDEAKALEEQARVFEEENDPQQAKIQYQYAKGIYTELGKDNKANEIQGAIDILDSKLAQKEKEEKEQERQNAGDAGSDGNAADTVSGNN